MQFDFGLGRINQACSNGQACLNVEIFQSCECFRILGLSGFPQKEQNQGELIPVIGRREKALDWDFESRNHLSGYRELWAGISEKRQN